jgi:hypothetical protein
MKALTLAGKCKQLTDKTRRNHGAELPRAQHTISFHKFNLMYCPSLQHQPTSAKSVHWPAQIAQTDRNSRQILHFNSENLL